MHANALVPLCMRCSNRDAQCCARVSRVCLCVCVCVCVFHVFVMTSTEAAAVWSQLCVCADPARIMPLDEIKAYMEWQFAGHTHTHTHTYTPMRAGEQGGERWREVGELLFRGRAWHSRSPNTPSHTLAERERERTSVFIAAEQRLGLFRNATKHGENGRPTEFFSRVRFHQPTTRQPEALPVSGARSLLFFFIYFNGCESFPPFARFNACDRIST